MKYVLVDTANTFFRARHVIRGGLDMKVGMAFHITFNSLKKAWNDFDADHIVFCLEGRSWRKDVYEPYKRNRQAARDALTEAQQEEEKVFWETFDSFRDFITNKTNCTVLQHNELEADDLVSVYHDPLKTIICSPDKDVLYQNKVCNYNYGKAEMIAVDETDTTRFLWKQVLMGDSTDGIPGLPKVGIKTADTWLDPLLPSEMPAFVLEKYLEKFGTSEGISKFAETFKLVYILKTPEDVLRETGIELPELVTYDVNPLNDDEWL